MVNLERLKERSPLIKKRQINCKIPVKYLDKLEEEGIGITEFIIQAFKETFD